MTDLLQKPPKMTIFVDDAPRVMGSLITLLIFAYGTYALRLYVRMGKTWGADDTAMTIALVSPPKEHGEHQP